MSVRPKRRRAAFLAALLSLVVVGTATAAYPSPAFDFAHPGSPHDPLYSPTGGNTDRPMLVVYAQFSDVAFPAGIDADDMRRGSSDRSRASPATSPTTRTAGSSCRRQPSPTPPTAGRSTTASSK
jgi:hypothetical protein